MRVFIAVDLNEIVKEELIKIQNELNQNSKLSLTKDFHITLKFFGEIDESQIDLIKKKLKEIKSIKFKLKLDSIGVFPSENYLRVVWVGLSQAEPLIDLTNKINNLLNDFKDDFKFHPHITLARVKFIENKREFIDKLNNIGVKPFEFEVSKFKLKKSTLTPEGPIYEDLGVFG